MFSRTCQVFVPQCTQVRGMATLKDIRVRLKSVKNTQKITKSMKMVSAAKYARAERELRAAKAYGLGASAINDQAEVGSQEEGNKNLVLALTSDRGLCGGVHSNIVKAIKAEMAENPSIENKFFLVGDKAKAMLQRICPKDFLVTFNEIGKKPPVFQDAAKIASAISNSEYEYDRAFMHLNIFRSVVSYNTTKVPLVTKRLLENAGNINVYDSVDPDVMQCYGEFMLCNQIYYGLKQAACSEQSSRMTAMDAATKNAGEMIDKLTLTYNRTRQAVITGELIEIISGAAAL